MTFASSGASKAMLICTVTTVPSGLATGIVSMAIPVLGVAVTAVTPWKFWPRMVMVKVCPRLLRIGVIESMFGGTPVPILKVFDLNGANSTRVVPRRTVTARKPADAPASTAIGTETWLPSGAATGVPTVMLLSGATETLVTSFSAKPEIVNVPDTPGESGGVETPVAIGPTATPTSGALANVVGAAGGFGSCSTTPSAGALNGPKSRGGGGVPSCRMTPSTGEATGVTTAPTAAVTVIVFCAVKTSDEVPAGVVTVTARGPVAAAALKVTVIGVPAGSTVGGLLMVIPLGGDTPTALAFWKFRPRIVSVTAGAPVCRKVGEIESKTAGGAITRNCAEIALENGTEAVPASTRTARIVCGAFAAMVALTVTDLPSALTAGVPSVTPSGGESCTEVTPCSWSPVSVNVVVSPIIPTAGVRPMMTLPRLTPTGKENAFWFAARGGVPSCRTTPRSGEETGVIGADWIWSGFTTLKVLAEVAVALDIPPGVTTCTSRSPVGAFAAIDSLTVASTPGYIKISGVPVFPSDPSTLASALALASTEIPVPGVSFTACIFWKLPPRVVSVPVVPTVAKIGLIEAISGGGSVMRILSAFGGTGRYGCCAPASTTFVIMFVIVVLIRFVSAAVSPVGMKVATVTGTVTERPSGATLNAPKVIAVYTSAGVMLTPVTPPSSLPLITTSVGPVSRVSLFGVTLLI